MTTKNKPGPKLPFDDDMISQVIDGLELGGEPVSERTVLDGLNSRILGNYSPRSGTLGPHIDRVMSRREKEAADRAISRLPEVNAHRAEFDRIAHAQLTVLGKQFQKLQETANIPLEEAHSEIRRLERAFDAEAAERQLESDRAAELHAELTTLKDEHERAMRLQAEHIARIRELEASLTTTQQLFGQLQETLRLLSDRNEEKVVKLHPASQTLVPGQN